MLHMNSGVENDPKLQRYLVTIDPPKTPIPVQPLKPEKFRQFTIRTLALARNREFQTKTFAREDPACSQPSY